MGIFDKLRSWLGRGPPADSPPRKEEGSDLLYDKIRIINAVDGTTIEGRDAVKAHFEAEQKLLDEHGMTLVFQIYRIDTKAERIEDLQGPKLAELKLDGGFVSGTDTVAQVKDKLYPLIEEASRSASEEGARDGLRRREADRMSFSFSSRRMVDDKKFYADHFILLPAWVQVLLHDCEVDELLALGRRLHQAARG